MTALLLALCHAHWPDLIVVTAPTLRSWCAAMFVRLFSGGVAGSIGRLASRLCRLDDLSINAAPTFLLRFTSLECFFLGRVALLASLPAYVLGGLDRGDAGCSADAAPTQLLRLTMPGRFVSRTVAGSIVRLAFPLGSLDDLSVNAAPTLLSAISLRFFFGGVALAARLPASGYGTHEDVSFVAAPTLRRRRWWRRRRGYRRTMPERFFSGTVAWAIFLPPFPPFPAIVHGRPAAFFLGGQDGYSINAAPTLRTRRRWWWRWRPYRWWR